MRMFRRAEHKVETAVFRLSIRTEMTVRKARMAESGWSFLMDGSDIDDGEVVGLEDGGERCHLTGGGQLDAIHEIGDPDGFGFRLHVVEWEKADGGNIFE